MKATLLEFKKQVDSISYADVLKIRETKQKHALDLESLEIPLKVANEYVVVMQDFLESLNFSVDRITAVECRRRDGFIPYSHNHGGLDGYAYRDQYSACQSTGFDNTDTVLMKNSDYNLKMFLEDHPELKDVDYCDWSNDVQDEYSNYESESDDTIQFQARVMFTSETTANIDFYVSASDSPYHRSSDDKLELEVEFKTPAGLARKLKAILKNDFVKCLSRNVSEGF